MGVQHYEKSGYWFVCQTAQIFKTGSEMTITLVFGDVNSLRNAIIPFLVKFIISVAKCCSHSCFNLPVVHLDGGLRSALLCVTRRFENGVDASLSIEDIYGSFIYLTQLEG